MAILCPLASFTRRPLKSTAGSLIAATLAIVAICLLSFDSAQAQEIKKPADCGSAPASASEGTNPISTTPQTQSLGKFGTRPAYYTGGEYFYGMINNLFFSPYIVPTIVMTDPQQTFEDESATTPTSTGSGPCRVGMVTTAPRR